MGGANADQVSEEQGGDREYCEVHEEARALELGQTLLVLLHFLELLLFQLRSHHIAWILSCEMGGWVDGSIIVQARGGEERERGTRHA